MAAVGLLYDLRLGCYAVSWRPGWWRMGMGTRFRVASWIGAAAAVALALIVGPAPGDPASAATLAGSAERGPACVFPPAARPQNPTWDELGPPARAEQACVFDSDHRRLVVFGGRVGGGPYGGGRSTNDLWILSLGRESRWVRLDASGEPPSPRFGSAGVFDSRHDRMLVFGGKDSSGERSDLWELSLKGEPRWRQLHPSGSIPPARYRHTAILDPATGSVLVFGGWGESELGEWYKDDLWRLTVGKHPTWSRLELGGPHPARRCLHTAVLAPDLGGIVIFGGASPKICPDPLTCAQQTNDVWLLSLTNPPSWTDLTLRISGEPPCGIQAHGATYDPVAKRMIVIDGYGAYGADTPCFGDIAGVWTLSFDQMRWSSLSVTSNRPGARYFASNVYDSDRRRILVYGGGGGTPYADVWALNLTPAPSWARVVPPDGIPPTPYTGRGLLVYDSPRDRLVTYEGSHVWSYSFGDDEGWTVQAAIGEVPPPRHAAASIFDPTRRRIIVHGGWDGRQFLSDTWELSLQDPPAWSRLATAGDAPASYAAAAIYDPLRDRMIISGGLGPDVTSQRNVWSLSLNGAPEWTPLAARGGWHPRGGHAAVYDKKRDEMVVFGGGRPDADSWGTGNDTWALALSNALEWRSLDTPLGQRPPSRAFHSLVQDPLGDRMIMLGGYVPGPFSRGPFDDAWEFRFDDRTWHLISPAGAALPVWTTPGAVYDSRRHRELVCENDWLWSLQLATEGRGRRRMAPDDVAPAVDGVVALRLNGPNPFSDSFAAEVSLRDAAPASLDLFDVSGRRVWSRAISILAGRRQLVRSEGMGHLRPGVYLLKLTQERQTKTARVVCVR